MKKTKSREQQKAQIDHALRLGFVAFGIVALVVIGGLAFVIWTMLSLESSWSGCSGYFASNEANRVATFARSIPLPTSSTVLSGPLQDCRTRGFGAVHSVTYNMQAGSLAGYTSAETSYENFLEQKGLAIISTYDGQLYMTRSNGHKVDIAFMMFPTKTMSDGSSTSTTLTEVSAGGKYTFSITVQDADR